MFYARLYCESKNLNCKKLLYCTASLQVNVSVNKQESRVVAGKPRYAAVNFDLYGVCRQLFVSFDIFSDSCHGRA